MDHGVRRRHTAAMGPHPRQQSTQQSTNIICDGSTSLKLEKKIFITSDMAINARRIDDDKQRQRCNVRVIDAAPPLGRIGKFRRHVTAPLDISERGQRGGRGSGRCRPRYLARTGGAHKDTRVFFWHNDGAVAPHNLAKKHGTPTM